MGCRNTDQAEREAAVAMLEQLPGKGSKTWAPTRPTTHRRLSRPCEPGVNPHVEQNTGRAELAVKLRRVEKPAIKAQ